MLDTEADPSHPPPSTEVNFSPVGDEREKLIRELRALPSPYAEREDFLRRCAVIAHGLPASLLGAIYGFRAQTSDDGVLSIHALPADRDLIPTASADSEVIKDKTTFFSESWLAIFGLLLGEPYGFIQEGSGELFVNVYPALKESDLLSSKSSAITLDLHTEVAFHPAIPDYILLFCLRPDRELKARTIYSGIKQALPNLGEEVIRVLRTPSFITGIDYSFGSENAVCGNGPRLGILSGNNDDPLMVFDPDLMVGVDEESGRAIKALKGKLDRNRKGVVLKAGDLLIIDNLKAVHGRTPFAARYDGGDRWLQRLVVKRDLRTVEKELGGKERILTWMADQFLNADSRRTDGLR